MANRPNRERRPPSFPILRLPLRAAGATVAAGALLLAAACAGKPAAAPPAAAMKVPVTVGKATREAVPVTLGAVGTVESPHVVSIRSQVGGVLDKVHFSEGQDVRQGQLLFTIDPRSFEASLAQAQAQLARDQALAANAQQDVARYADLVKKDYVTQEQFDSIRANAASLAATVQADQAAVENMKLQLGYTRITAPISGRTGSVLVHAGNLVKANADTGMVSIQQMEPIDIRFAVPQQYLEKVRQRDSSGALEVTAKPEESGAEAHQGKLTFIDNAVDTSTGTIDLKASFPNHDRALWPGQFVDVSLTLATQEDAVVVPAPAVQSGQNGDYVFVVKPDMSVESRPVKVARTMGTRTVIAEGLEGGETVVTDGQLRLKPGAVIEAKPPAGTPAAAQEGGP
jgi:membrane fusion protein, multidrug efflux system